MINVKVVYDKNQGKVFPYGLESYTYYSCKKKTKQERFVFIIITPKENDPRIVLWLNSKFNSSMIGWDSFSVLEEDYYDFQEVKDAELTFYV